MDTTIITTIATVAGVIVAALGVIAAWLALRRRWSNPKPSFKAIAKAAHDELNQAMRVKPSLDDPLSSNANGYQWTELSQSDGSCLFKANEYYVATLDQYYRFYLGRSEHFLVSDLVLQVQMKIINGNEGGLIFRWRQTAQAAEFYYFYITTNGSYGLVRGEHTGMAERHRVVHQSSSKVINRGLYQVNTITARASGSTIDLFANGEFLVRMPETAPDAGYLGFASGPYPSEVVFSHAKMWQL